MEAQQNCQEKQVNKADVVNKGVETNEDSEIRKIFVGGLAPNVTNDDLREYFSQYGEVTEANIRFHPNNPSCSRGFGFVEFASGDACRCALSKRKQTIKNKQVEVKLAKSPTEKKVFVGGLPADFPEEDLIAHFEQFGKVEKVEWPVDKVTMSRRNFAFIVFEEKESADRAAAKQKQTFRGRHCDVKKAVPQPKRFDVDRRAEVMMRANYGTSGNAGMLNRFYGQPAWNQMSGLGAYATGTAGMGTWSDLYRSQTRSNYYQQGTDPRNTYGSAYGVTHGQSNQRSSGNQHYYPQQQSQQY